MGLRHKPHTALIQVKEAVETYHLPRRWFTYHIERKHLTPLTKVAASHAGLDQRCKWISCEQIEVTIARFPYHKRPAQRLRAS